MARYAQGGNYTILIENGIVMCRVWRRPDVDPVVGANFAREKIRHLEQLSREPRLQTRALLFDLREAPPVVGAITKGHLLTIFQAWKLAQRRIALLVSEDPAQYEQLRSLLDSNQIPNALVSPRFAEVLAWVQER